MRTIIQIHPDDNVAVVAAKTEATTVPPGHKIALRDIAAGENIIKYGFPIGHATRDIRRGEWVSEREIKTNLAGECAYSWEGRRPACARQACALPAVPTFMGFRRPNGAVATRNELWIVPTVGCVSGVAQRLAEMLRAEAPAGMGAVVAYPHNYGCSQLGDDHETTRRILRDIVLHPNAGAVLVVGLGCENNRPHEFTDFLEPYDHDRIRLLVCQEEADELSAGMALLRPMAQMLAREQRVPLPVSALRIGLKCGGSDGLSGITANPLVGAFSDWLCQRGGTTVLTEVPEMFGAETLLMNRCATRQLFDQTVEMVNGFKRYFLAHGQPVGENPSPGNKAGGISTLEEKSLGCVQKGGTSPVCGVLRYGDRLQAHGLNLLAAPGNDLVAATALAAAGCHLVLFTTGRGTPFGTCVPTVKIATNTPLAEAHPKWIDFNAGTIIEDDTTQTLLPAFVSKIIDIASGQPARNEHNGYRGIAIFKDGVTL